MFAAAISLVGLAATVYLVLREAKAIRAQSGTVAKSALGWSVVFGLFQVFLTIWGAVGLVAQNEPLAFVMLILTNAILTGCAWASIARDRIAPRVFAFAAPDAPAPTGKLARAVDFAKSIDASKLQPAILTPYPGTPVYQRMVEEDRMVFTSERHFKH